MKHLATTLALVLAGMAASIETCAAETADLFFSAGLSRQQSGEFKEAVRLYTKAIESDGRCIMAFQMRATAWQMLRQYPKAIEDYSMVISLGDPNFQAVAYLNRGIVKNMSGRYLEAIPDFSMALSIDKRMAVAYFHRGIARSKSGDTTGYLADFIQAAQLGDTDAERLLNALSPGWRQAPK
jgi:tetratricopeptide (TPR) repeat protein